MVISEFLTSQKQLTAKWLHLSVGLGLISGFLLIAQAWYLALTVNGVVFENKSLDDVQFWLWMLLGIFIVRALLAWASEQAAFFATAKIKQQVRDTLHRHIQALGPISLGNQRSGESVNTLVDGVEALENYYARYLPAMSLVVLVPLSILVFVFPIDWISGLVMIGTAPLIPFFMILIGKGTERLNKKQWRKLARMSAHFLDMIQGLTTLKIFNTSKREAQVIAKISEEYRRSTMSVLRVAFLSSLALEFLATVSIAIVAVLIGFRLYYGEMDFLWGFFILLLAPEFYLPLRNMGTHYHSRMEAVGAAEQMVDILDQEITNNASTHKNSKTIGHFKAESISIDFDQVSFSYEQGRQALDNVSLEITAGQRVALIGASGAGKSTIANLLLRFVNTNEGSIKINGTDLNTIPLEDWRRHLAWVPQRPYLFHGSIADNIRLGKPEANDEQVREAATLANCEEFIEAQADGYQTLIGEKGEGLSGGQIQRLSLARAFLKDAPLLILDEATANLDKQSEILIQQSIDILSKGRTVVTIAHRLNTIQASDQIFVLDKGKLVLSGTHEQLISKSAENNHYQKMLKTFQAAQLGEVLE